MLKILRYDIKRYINKHSGRISIKNYLYFLFEQGIWALIVYRYGRWARGIKIPILDLLLKLSAFLGHKIIEIATSISLPASAEIGKGFYIGHFGGIIVHSNAKIGEGCSIGTGVVVGTRGLGSKGVPIIGNNVYIGVGAKVLGGINIGNNVKIGANSVVISDIPDNATAVGIPAKVVKKC